jgi:hypothetical protein
MLPHEGGALVRVALGFTGDRRDKQRSKDGK